MWEVQIFSGPGREEDYICKSLEKAMEIVKLNVMAFRNDTRPDVVEIFLNDLENAIQFTVVIE